RPLRPRRGAPCPAAFSRPCGASFNSAPPTAEGSTRVTAGNGRWWSICFNSAPPTAEGSTTAGCTTVGASSAGFNSAPPTAEGSPRIVDAIPARRKDKLQFGPSDRGGEHTARLEELRQEQEQLQFGPSDRGGEHVAAGDEDAGGVTASIRPLRPRRGA